eukprot:gene1966-3817_t
MESMEEINSYISPPGNKDTSDSDNSDDFEDARGCSSYKDEEKKSKRGHVDVDERFSSAKKFSSANNSRSLKHDLADLMDKCKYIPMRLTVEERRVLKVLENALEVSDYTDTVDVFSRKSKQDRIISGLVDVLSISSGLLIANNFNHGERRVKGRTLSDNLPFFRDMFEIGRRYKVMNPTKMRNTYGKLMFLLQDAETPLVRSETKLSLVKDLLMVWNFLEEKEGMSILSDPLIIDATQSVDNSYGDVSREDLIRIGREKDSAVKVLIEKYTTEELSSEDIERVLSSISDYNAYLIFNVHPVDKMIQLLKESFDPKNPEENFSLALSMTSKFKSKGGGLGSSFSSYLSGGSSSSYGSGSGYSNRFSGGGAKLSHDHATQYLFVLQSLTLWKEIMTNMTRLWTAADKDLLLQPYHLSDTGQGLNRMQSCPSVRRLMDAILSRVQSRVGHWVGLAVVHLGDRDVPNALVFIDKYSQVPRILAPIATCIESLPGLVTDEPFHAYVREEWTSLQSLRMQILSDFFKHGFDGSGDDGGSCIDGRLTSAWNWCSKLTKKPYYHVFMFTGFQGFDGDWKD